MMLRGIKSNKIYPTYVNTSKDNMLHAQHVGPGIIEEIAGYDTRSKIRWTGRGNSRIRIPILVGGTEDGPTSRL